MFFFFSSGGSAECCDYLLAADADDSLRTPQEWTALHLAALQGHVEAGGWWLRVPSRWFILKLPAVSSSCSLKDRPGPWPNHSEWPSLGQAWEV